MMEPFPTSAQREEEWYHQMATNENIVFWRIMAQAQLVGVTTIREIDWISRHGVTAVHIGDRSQRGNGYASDAVRLRTAYAFNELGLERLESESLASNLAMHRVLEKAGYQKIGRKRHYFYSGGMWHDAYVFEILRGE